MREGGILVCHQVKRQRSKGTWSIQGLGSSGILKNFLVHLKAGSRCVFVSMEAASDLRELTERVASSTSWSEFDREFLKAKEWRTQFDNLIEQWGGLPEVEAYQLLKRVEVRTLDERSLKDTVKDRLALLVKGDASNAMDILAQFALDSIHKELSSEALWTHLQGRGVEARAWNDDLELRRKLFEKIEGDLAALEGRGITGEIIPRPEAERAMEHLRAGRQVLLTGGAGSGKSGILAQVIRKARIEHWPVLVLRADRSIEGESPEQYGAALGLPGPPSAVLAGVAGEGDALLVVDQLDAVSRASGRHPERFEILLEIIRRTKNYSRVHVVVACRKFDVDNDERFRDFSKNKDVTVVDVEKLDETSIERVLGATGVKLATLASNLKSLLEVPLNLRLFVELARAQVSDVGRVRTTKDLYDRFWDLKQQVLREKLREPGDWNKVIETLCDTMSERQELSIPLARLDAAEQAWKAMASEGVLVRDGQQVRFFHESLFDYSFARLFARRGNSLKTLLQTGHQELFLRAQIRQILLHERAAEPGRYLEDARMLLCENWVRLHLQLAALALVCAMEDPTADEWALVACFAEKSGDVRGSKVWGALGGSIAWFGLANAEGAWARWLRAEAKDVAQSALAALFRAYSHSPAKVMPLILSGRETVDGWSKEVSGFLYLSGEALARNRDLGTLLYQALEAGAYDGESLEAGGMLWEPLGKLVRVAPEEAVNFFAIWLKRLNELEDVNGQGDAEEQRGFMNWGKGQAGSEDAIGERQGSCRVRGFSRCASSPALPG
ncbi:NACHT domain-containing protein [Corallococcus exercitus]|uniref:NACHT domain-containing protein n=1 Tax=Corallococcus exercitus TaxID=2316736 RepID=UPI0035D4BEEC